MRTALSVGTASRSGVRLPRPHHSRHHRRPDCFTPLVWTRAGEWDEVGARSPSISHAPQLASSGLPRSPRSDVIADAPQRRQQLFLNGVKEAIDRRRLVSKIAATSGGTGVIQTL